jgi:glucose/arabinose dehydrogenase
LNRRNYMRLNEICRGGITACAMFAAAAAAQAQSFEVVASGLKNPRGLAFAPNGALYVVEAGNGGTQNCHVGPTGPRCFGLSGAIVRIDLRRDITETVVDGLPSLAPASGFSATGLHDLGFQGQGNLYFTVGFGGDPALRQTALGAVGSRMARVARLLPNGSVRFTADLGTYEGINNPDDDLPDTNPYGILVLPGRRIVADAGANALLEISANGDIRTLAVFPEFQLPMAPSRDAVPTGLALGPDGAYYVGQLTGGPFAVGIANVFRVPPEGGEPEIYAEGFTNIIDIAFGPDGSLYVLQIASPIPNFGGGALVRVAPDGTRTQIGEDLFAPGGIAIAKDGTIYVTNNSISPVGGEVLSILP